MARKELHLNDPAHTATSRNKLPNEEAVANAPLEQDSGKTKVAASVASGVGGAVAGSASGLAVGGPIGAAIGAIAGAVGGWWMGHGSAAAKDWSELDDAHYREHYDAAGGAAADRRYEEVRAAYHLGYVASRNPDYAGRGFDEIEGDLRHGWTEELQGRHGTWDAVRDRVRYGYEQPRGLSHVDRREPGADPAADAARRAHDRVADERGR